MSRIYWIEDEIDRLEGTRELLEDLVGAFEVWTLSNAKQAQQAVDLIKADGGPIILDLMIPTGDPALPAHRQRGPEVGLSLLRDLQSSLGADWPVFIVSGNISFDIKETLIERFGIPIGRIFTKPLNAKNELLVEQVVAAADRFGRR